MRILSLWQPWASAMALGLKKIETRSWKTDYRGPVAIHATQRAVKLSDIPPVVERLLPKNLEHAAHRFRFPLGCIVAAGYLSDCMTTTTVFQCYPGLDTEIERLLGNYNPGRYGWVFERISPLRQPLHYRGGQGLRSLPEEDAKRVMGLLA